MKTFIFIGLLLFSRFSLAKVIDHPLLSLWTTVMEGSKSGNTIASYERKIYTPYSRYTVAQVTLAELQYEGEKDIQSVKSFLQREFKLTGLSQKTYQNATRFEGYRPDIRRQVVVFVSFADKKIKVSSAFYRPTYGKNIALEVELIHRKYHGALEKVSYVPFFNIAIPLIREVHAQTDCSQCSGNPICLMLCTSAGGSGGTGGSGGSFSISGLDLSGIESALQTSNTQLSALNANVGTMNTNMETTNVQLENVNANWGDTNNQFAIFNQNYSNTNQELKEANKNLQNLTNVVDQRSNQALQESQAWRAMTEKESTEWRNMTKAQSDRGLAVAEKMADPQHLFKMATYSAAGAVLGASVANLAINGVTSAISFLYKWATGELKEMKQEELLKEFSAAMKVYDESTKISKDLEASIDSVLSNMALQKKFQLENSDILANIQKYIIETEFEIEDAKKDRCVEDLVNLNQKMLEFKSLAKILDMSDPQKTMCLQLKDMFRRLAEIEGVLQNARPNLLKAEEALNWQKAKEQNEGGSILDKIQKGRLAAKVKKTQDKQREKLYKRNVKDSEKIAKDVVSDCRDSFKAIDHDLKRKEIKAYCETLVSDKNASTVEGLSQAFPDLRVDETESIMMQFQIKYIPLGLKKYATYEKERKELFEDFADETNRHQEEVSNLKDRLQIDPRIALDEMSAINAFVEKLMKEQAYIYTDGMKAKKAKFEAACQSVN